MRTRRISVDISSWWSLFLSRSYGKVVVNRCSLPEFELFYQVSRANFTKNVEPCNFLYFHMLRTFDQSNYVDYAIVWLGE